MLDQLLGSRIKARILLYFSLRGACSGRGLAAALNAAPTPVFKALRQLEEARVLCRDEAGYRLNSSYPHYRELLEILSREAEMHPALICSFFPRIKASRRVDPVEIYRFQERLTGRKPLQEVKLFEALKGRYA